MPRYEPMSLWTGRNTARIRTSARSLETNCVTPTARRASQGPPQERPAILTDGLYLIRIGHQGGVLVDVDHGRGDESESGTLARRLTRNQTDQMIRPRAEPHAPP